MSSFLSLIRFPNLLIIAFTQYMMRYAVIQPIVQSYGFELQMSGFTFFCLVLSTICTAAAGYAINDYFDVRTDHINRPEDVVVGKIISRRKTMMIHIILSVSGVLLGGYVTWRAGVPELVLLYMVIAGMLWLYSTTYKKQFLIGNIIVALFTALVPLMTLLDIPPLNAAYRAELLEMGKNFNAALIWVLGFAAFAFLTTLSREIIKDAEDVEGDQAYGCRSIPIVLGTKPAKWIVISINLTVVIAIGVIFFTFLRYLPNGKLNIFSLLYLFIFLVLPLLYLSKIVYKATLPKDYRKAGNCLKLVMLAGILYSVVIRHIIS